MVRYIIKRLLIGVVTIWALITITFFLIRIMPGSPFEADNLSQSAIEQLETTYGLNEPMWKQYILYMENLMHGDLGVSYKKNVSVNTLIARGFPYTLSIGLLSIAVSAFIGILMGIWMATSRRQAVKNTLLGIATLGVSIPGFVTAILLMMIFGVWWPVLPIVGLGSPANYILPVAAQSFGQIASIARLTKSTYSEAIQMDYVTMARAKGLSNMYITVRHVLKNALIPVVTYFGPAIAFLITGSFVVESIFSIPGIGREFTNAITNRDYTVVLGFSVFIGVIITVANLAVDIICSLIDPRIKLTN
ncbi:ABC transporter permease [Lachnospiraceae bacterium 210521-DFI.5.20]|uniref:ABC transporter permease n=1 Tax=Fusicatenibacter saccharivorans TaxID=1150298 RepID=A0AAE3F0Y6_9FIRM|nr:ABC transporter permease [Fusicatenibacter saccharivorans]MCB6300430.1 ABC transporter permease [Lachnospiraceae bacterium 210521-DFI.5.20]MCG4764126.1 ABC transporter permease [Fusicatenibacter saccharivorans]